MSTDKAESKHIFDEGKVGAATSFPASRVVASTGCAHIVGQAIVCVKQQADISSDRETVCSDQVARMAANLPELRQTDPALIAQATRSAGTTVAESDSYT